ncbi:hypothetical protein BKA70DRAFT_1531173 [Coprinopsis sp. MPI-PUGE-AT-0042]|nr:hypothetical protein BKA70DRAFT_1531173 [Coprinopsis sp. MPI-PUGE-AT-0042]
MDPVLAGFVSTMRTGVMWQAAGCTVVFYDHITSFEREVELVWSQEWSLVNGLYLFNRYFGDAVFIHGSSRIWASGKVLDQVISTTTFLAVSRSDRALRSIVVKRIVCMYGNSKKVLWVLLTAMAVLVVYSTVMTGLVSNAPSLVIRIPSTNIFETCVPAGEIEQWYWSFLFFTLTFDTLVFGLALYRGIVLIRERNETRRHQERDSAIGRAWRMRGDFVGVLVRDSVLFPLIGVFIQVFCILAWSGVLPLVAFQIVLIFAAAAWPTLGCRLILNLREAYHKPFYVEYDQSQVPAGSLVMPSFGDSPSEVSSTPTGSIQLHVRGQFSVAKVDDP